MAKPQFVVCCCTATMLNESTPIPMSTAPRSRMSGLLLDARSAAQCVSIGP